MGDSRRSFSTKLAPTSRSKTWASQDGYLVNRAYEQRAVADGVRWISAQPYHFPAKRYLEGLSKGRMNSRVKLSLVFEESPSPEERTMFQEACAGAATVEASSWADRTLTLTTPHSQRISLLVVKNESYYSNAQVHLFTRNIMDKAVPALHARRPILRVKVNFID